MFHYKSLSTDEVGAIRQRGPEPLPKEKSSEGQKQSACASQNDVTPCQ